MLNTRFMFSVAWEKSPAKNRNQGPLLNWETQGKLGLTSCILLESVRSNVCDSKEAVFGKHVRFDFELFDVKS